MLARQIDIKRWVKHRDWNDDIKMSWLAQKHEQIFWKYYSMDGILSFKFLSTETEEEKKAGVDPKLVFPLKLWLLSWFPSHRKRWNSNTGLPQSDDKEDWVQLGERKQTGSADQVSSIFWKLVRISVSMFQKSKRWTLFWAPWLITGFNQSKQAHFMRTNLWQNKKVSWLNLCAFSCAWHQSHVFPRCIQVKLVFSRV